MNNKILIVDDHPVVRMTVRHLVECKGCTVVGEADNAADALRLTHELRPDTLVLDIGLPHLDGLAIIDQLSTLRLPIKIIVLTAKESNHIALRCMQAGAHGFVNKHQDLCELINMIHPVRTGYGYCAQRVSPWERIERLEDGQKIQFKHLSLRELEVLQQLTQGLTHKQIAERMALSGKTISTYKVRLMQKLNARTLLELHDWQKTRAPI